VSADPVATWQAIGALVREAQALGVEFRLRGDGVVFSGLEAVPPDLAEQLQRQHGNIYRFLDGPKRDAPAIALAKKLGVRIRLITMVAGIPAVLAELERDASRDDGVIAIDFETAPLPKFALPAPAVRLNKGGIYAAQQPENKDKTATDPHRASVRLVQLYGGGQFSFLFHGADVIAALLGSAWIQQAHLVAHNSVFELGFLQAFRATHTCETFVGKRGRIECTEQAIGLCYGVGHGGSERGLENASDKVLNIRLPKELQTSDWSVDRLSKGQCCYASNDVVNGLRIWRSLHAEMQLQDRMAAYELQRGAAPAVADMQRRGVTIDCAEHSRLVEAWTAELQAARHLYLDKTGKPAPSKPAERQEWLQELLQPGELAAWPRTPGSGDLSTKGSHLKRLGLIHPDALPLLAILQHEKLLSAFGPRLLDHISPATGRIHPGYHIAATKAGRFSATRPNLQQMPAKKSPEFRRCIVPGFGNIFLSADFNQIELRAVAWLADDDEMNAIYASGGDLHLETAATISGLPIDQAHEMRSRAKAINFGSTYGIGAGGLVEYAYDAFDVIITHEEAQEFLNSFFRRFHSLARWRQHQIDTCMPRGEIRVMSGRVVRAEWEPYGRIRQTQCLNIPVQGIAADAMLLALRRFHAALRRHRIRGGICSTIHDEILVEVAEGDAELTAELLHAVMLEAFTQTFDGAPTTNVVTVKRGYSWGELQ
jgi:DNA polymerase-1